MKPQILLIAITLFASGFQAQAEYCDGRSIQLNLPKDEWDSINSDTLEFVNAFFHRTGKASASRLSEVELIQKTNSILNRARTQLNSEIAALKANTPEAGYALKTRLVRYAMISADLMTVMLAIKPHSRLNINDIQNHFGVSIAPKWFNNDFQTPASFVMIPRSKQFLLAPSPSYIMSTGIRALSMSPKSDAKTTYVHAARCLVINDTALSYARNEVVRAAGNLPMPPQNGSVCRGLTVHQIIGIHRASAQAIAFKRNLSQTVPSLESKLDGSVQKVLQEYIKVNSAKIKNFSPDWAEYVMNPDVSAKEREALAVGAQKIINGNKLLNFIAEGIESKNFAAELQKLNNSCKLTAPLEKVQEDILNSFSVELALRFQEILESTSFAGNNAILLRAQLMELSSRLRYVAVERTIFRTMLKYTPLDVPEETMGVAAAEFATNLSGRMAFLQPAHYNFFDQAANAVKARQTKSSDVIRQETMTEIIAAAHKASVYMNPATHTSELPYVPSAMMAYHTHLFNGVSAASQRQLTFLTKTDDRNQLLPLYERSRKNLMDELKSLGGTLQAPPSAAKSAGQWILSSWPLNWLAGPNENQKRIRELSADIHWLDSLAAGMGLKTKNERRHFQDAINDLKMTGRPLQKLVKFYRQALVTMLAGEHRIVDMPIALPNNKIGTRSDAPQQRRPLYALIAGQPRAEKIRWIDTALSNVTQNHIGHFQRIGAATNVNQLRDYILNSTLLAYTFGMNDLQKAIIAQDVDKATSTVGFRPSQLLIGRYKVYPHLVRQHMKHLDELENRNLANSYRWDDLYLSSMVLGTPFIAGWLGKVVTRRIPGLRWVSGAISSNYMRTSGAWNSYWDFFMKALWADIVYTSYEIAGKHNAINSLERMSYTDHADRPLLFADSYIDQRKLFGMQLKGLYLVQGINLAVISLPGILNTYADAKLTRAAKVEREMAVDKSLQTRVAGSADRKFRYLEIALQWEFRALGMRKPSFRPGEINQAFERIRSRGRAADTRAAEIARRNIITATTEALLPVSHLPASFRMNLEAAHISAADFNALTNVYRQVTKGAS